MSGLFAIISEFKGMNAERLNLPQPMLPFPMTNMPHFQNVRWGTFRYTHFISIFSLLLLFRTCAVLHEIVPVHSVQFFMDWSATKKLEKATGKFRCIYANFFLFHELEPYKWPLTQVEWLLRLLLGTIHRRCGKLHNFNRYMNYSSCLLPCMPHPSSRVLFLMLPFCHVSWRFFSLRAMSPFIMYQLCVINDFSCYIRILHYDGLQNM